MGQRGPLPKPTQRKKLEGNPGRRPLPVDEPEPVLLTKIPDPPSWFDEVAKQAWWMVCRELQDAKMLAALDLPIVEHYCMAYTQWRAMVAGVQKEGFTIRVRDEHGKVRYSQATPEATLMRQFASDCNRWAKVIGLGPAYRVGLKLGSDPEDDDQIGDELDSDGIDTEDHNPPPPRKRAPRSRAAKKQPAKKRAAKKRVAKKKPKGS